MLFIMAVLLNILFFTIILFKIVKKEKLKRYILMLIGVLSIIIYFESFIFKDKGREECENGYTQKGWSEEQIEKVCPDIAVELILRDISLKNQTNYKF